MRLFLNAEEERKLDQFDELEEEKDFLVRENHAIATDVRELAFVAKGCPRHPSYRGVRQPTATCENCTGIFTATQFLRGRGYRILESRKLGRKGKA
jgi:hypothetical protein